MILPGNGSCDDRLVANRPVYSVAAVPPESVREDLQRVWRASLPLTTSAEAKFDQLYREAADPATHVFVLRVREADVTEEKIVGTIGICVRRYLMGGREVRAAVSADFAVDPAHRHLLPALQVARLAREHVREHFDLGYGYPNRHATGVMLRAGFSELGQTSRHVYVLRPAAYFGRIRDRPTNQVLVLAKLLARPSLAYAVGAIADGSRLALTLVRAAPAAWGYRLTWSVGPHPQMDALWEAARHEYPIVGLRTSAFLSRRYPGARLAGLIRRGGDLRAYAIIEIDPVTGAAHIRDLFGHHDAFEPLLDLLLLSLWRLGAASASVSLLGSPRVRRILARRGFVTRGERGTVVIQVGARAPAGVNPVEPDSWHLFDADEDA